MQLRKKRTQHVLEIAEPRQCNQIVMHLVTILRAAETVVHVESTLRPRVVTELQRVLRTQGAKKWATSTHLDQGSSVILKLGSSDASHTCNRMLCLADNRISVRVNSFALDRPGAGLATAFDRHRTASPSPSWHGPAAPGLALAWT